MYQKGGSRPGPVLMAGSPSVFFQARSDAQVAVGINYALRVPVGDWLRRHRPGLRGTTFNGNYKLCCAGHKPAGHRPGSFKS